MCIRDSSSTVASLRNSIHSIGGDTGRSSVTGVSSARGRHSPSAGGSFYYSNSAAALYPPHLGGNGGSNSYHGNTFCLLYTSPSPRDRTRSRMPSSA
eukprot:TRINITY_DN2057_c0_g1_i1.p1 TRINITY_DN2057_c0_g1~~TRINITY_DN2057_c0_g1_i1.p1  ORF type:complete len:106 (-),score=25.69 TRINITY_DN2057_c0_g1_i1:66-356(-)